MTRKIRFTTAPVKIAFQVVGDRCAVQLVVMTFWTPGPAGLPTSVAEFGYHSPKSRRKFKVPTEDACEFTHGECYYDGHASAALPLFEILLTQGDEALWAELEKRFIKRFGRHEEKVK